MKKQKQEWYKLKRELDQLKREEKNSKIFSIIESELASSYWIEKYEQKLIEYKNDVLKKETEEKEYKHTNLSFEQLHMVLKNENLPTEVKANFLFYLDKFPLIKYKNEIQEIFYNSSKTPEIIFIILLILKSQEINFDFKIKDQIINPITFDNILKSKWFNKKIKKIKELTFKNPNLTNLTIHNFNIFVMEKYLFEKQEIENLDILKLIKHSKKQLGID